MRTLIFLGMLLLSCTAFAASDCRTVEYPDHYEVVCVGAAEQPSAYQTGQEQIPGEEQTVASDQTHEPEQPSVPPEMIVRNDLARLHMASGIKLRSAQ